MIIDGHALRRFVQIATAILLGAGGLLSPAPMAHGDWHTLTGWFPTFTNSVSELPEFTPNSQTLVYLADAEVDDVQYLYAAPVAGGTPLRLNPDLELTGDVLGFKLSVDGQAVVYRSALNSRALQKLYRVPIGGGAAVQLSGDASLHSSVDSFDLDPITGSVVYAAHEAVSDQPALYVVPLAGGTPVKISGALIAGAAIYTYHIDSFGGRVVYLANAEDLNRYELYSVPLAGGTVVKLSPVGGYTYSDIEINPAAAMVVFTAAPNGSTQRHLYRNATSGGALVQLNVALDTGEEVVSHHLTPDHSKVVYGIRTGPALGAHTRGDLYAVPTAGGSSTPLSLAADPSYGADVIEFAVTPDSQRVVMNYQLLDLLAPEIQSVKLDGTDRQTLVTQPGLVDIGTLYVSADGQWVIFRDTVAQDVYRLPIGGGSALSLGVASWPTFSGDGQRLIALALDPAKEPTAPYDLYSIGLSDLSRRNLTRLEPGAAVIEWSHVAPDGVTMAYTVDHDLGPGARLEIRVTDGSAAQYRLQIPALQK